MNVTWLWWGAGVLLIATYLDQWWVDHKSRKRRKGGR